MDIYDFIEEKELKKNDIELIIDDIKIEIPEELIQERINLIGISREEINEMLKQQAIEYKECLIINKKYNKNTFANRFINYIDSELAVYRL